MKRIIGYLLGFAIVISALYWAVIWRLSSHSSHNDPLDNTASPIVQTRFERLVIETMVPAILGDATLESEVRTPRVDDEGDWASTDMVWRLPQRMDTSLTAEELAQMTADLAPHATVYRSSPDDGVEVLRIYLGKRLIHHLTLQPTLSTLLPPQGEAPALLAIVVTELGHNGRIDQEIIDTNFPLTVSIEPFAPFALRDARGALQSYKEVIVTSTRNDLTSVEIAEAMSAVPNSTGLLLSPAPSELPHAALTEAGYYLLGLRAATDTPAIRHATNEGIRLITSDLSIGDEGLLRFQHQLRTEPSLVVTLPATSEHLSELLEFVGNAPASLLRPVYLSEVLDFQSSGRSY